METLAYLLETLRSLPEVEADTGGSLVEGALAHIRERSRPDGDG
jgi:hypothetical protein